MAEVKLGYRPGLDALRAVAVVMVVTSHAFKMPVWFGTAGVVVFFSLSGFLITKLLLEEKERGGIDLRGFYVRRARRLLPALPLVLVVAAMASVGSPVLLQVAASAFYVQNLVVGFADLGGSFNHFWSLALEEQFYLVWPLVVIGIPRARAVCAWSLPVLLAVRFGVNGTAAQTPLREAGFLLVDSLLAGAWLAFRVQTRGLPKIPAGVAVAAVAVIGWFTVDPTAVMLTWGFTALAVASAVLVAWAAAVRSAPAVLVWIGRRSYGIYLWHVPLLMLIDSTSPWRAVAGIAATLVVAECSWRWVESRFTSRRPREQQADHTHVAAHGVGGMAGVPVYL